MSTASTASTGKVLKKKLRCIFYFDINSVNCSELGKKWRWVDFFHVNGVNSTDITTSLEVFPNIFSTSTASTAKVLKKNGDVSFILTSTASTANELGKKWRWLEFFHVNGVNSTDIKTGLEVFLNIFSTSMASTASRAKVLKKNEDVSFFWHQQHQKFEYKKSL